MSDSNQLNRIENLLLSIDSRLKGLEERQQQPRGIEQTVVAPSPSTKSSSSPNSGNYRGRHPELPSDRHPTPSCAICHGLGLVQCKSCLGKGGEVKCDPCNGMGKDKFDKSRYNYVRKPCTFCNGAGVSDCYCMGGVKGYEFCRCTMNEREKKQEQELETVATNLGINALTMGTNAFTAGSEIFKGFGGGF